MISEEVRQGYATAAAIEEQNSVWITGGTVHAGQLALYIEPSAIVDVCRFLKQQGFRLSGITAVDWFPLDPRFEVVYLLHSLERNERIRLKCKLPSEEPEIETVTTVWEGANWYERETWDLFGIRFLNHPNLTRIMMPDEWEGHPLRKDFPIHGYRYSYTDEETA
jgi:NADH-quinone oxidoreductase subunit C